MENEMIERVADAIDAVNLISRFNDWTSDHVPGWPIEICRVDDGADPVVIERFRAEVGEEQALADVLAIHRARAAIEAMREPTEAMLAAYVQPSRAVELAPGLTRRFETLGSTARGNWDAMIDAALQPRAPTTVG